MKRTGRKSLLTLQTAYYFLTGLWPLVHITSFMEVSGYKTDVWLVKTVGALILCAALTFVVDLRLREYSLGVTFLSLSTATALFAIDLYYSLSGVISKVYLADGLFQLVFIAWWILFFRRKL
ncbi:hypothetical protein [Fluviicola sp.]|uniref:hypothetical protein n=1 Tax=Fluviicola sp. TaxID=1917219 RepID=UPI0031E352C0